MGPDGPRSGRHSSGIPESPFTAGDSALTPRAAPGLRRPALRARPLRAAVLDRRDRWPPGRRPGAHHRRFPPRLRPARPRTGRDRPAGRARVVVLRDQRPPGAPADRAAQQDEPPGRAAVGSRVRRRPRRVAPPLGAAPADALGRLGPAALPPRRRRDDAATVAQPLVPAAPRPDDQWDAGTGDAAVTTTPRPIPSTRAPGRTRPAGSTSSAPTSRRSRPPPAAEAAEAAGREAADGGPPRGRPGTIRDDLEHDDLDPDGLVHDEHFGEDIPVKPYDPRAGRSAAAPASVRRPVLAAGARRTRRRHRRRRAEAAHADRPVLARLHRSGHGRGRDPRQRRRHAQRHRADPRRRRRRRLDRPVHQRRRGQRGLRRDPARCLRAAAADERPGGPRPDARPRGPPCCPGSPSPRA